jgi:apurinic endonuclease APN1
MSIASGIDNVIYDAIEIGANAVQIFLSPPTNTSAGKPIPNPEVIEQMIKNTGIYLVVHGKYIINFCKTGLKWQHDVLESDLRKANSIGKDIGVIIHQGKNVQKLDRNVALKNFVDNIETVLDITKDIDNPIYLENSCQQGNELGYTLEELATIWNMFNKKSHKRLGFCLDTCHLFVSGTLQMKDAADVDSFFNKFDTLIGLSYLKVIHFNDSKYKFDSHNDNHDDIGEGYIGSNEKGGSLVGLKQVVHWAQKYNVPLILETPHQNIECKKQLEILNSWVDSNEPRGRSPTRKSHSDRSKSKSKSPKKDKRLSLKLKEK